MDTDNDGHATAAAPYRSTATEHESRAHRDQVISGERGLHVATRLRTTDVFILRGGHHDRGGTRIARRSAIIGGPRVSLKRTSIVLVFIVCSCGGGAAMYTSKPESMEGVPTAPGNSPLPPDSRDRIQALEAELDRDRAQMQLPEPAPTSRPAEPYYQAPETDSRCRLVQTSACTTSCSLSASICKNAEKICDIAHELPNDTVATQKCARANLICEAAHTKCCSCQ